MKIDKPWFVEQLKRAGISQRELAEYLNTDPASLSRMLSGKRKMQMPEASQIAARLGVSIVEVNRAAGIDISRDKDWGAVHNVVQRLIAHATAYAQERGRNGDMKTAGAIYDDLKLATTVLGPLLSGNDSK